MDWVGIAGRQCTLWTETACSWLEKNPNYRNIVTHDTFVPVGEWKHGERFHLRASSYNLNLSFLIQICRIGRKEQHG